jgi:signal transduction histidine kinase
MPKMTGIDMVKEIKKIDLKQHIIFTTAHSESGYFIEAINLHVDGYILKPIDLDILEDKIEEIKTNINLKYSYIKQEEELKQKDMALLKQSKNAQMGEMIKNIAHQWRQPLSVISTSATGMMLKKEMDMLQDNEILHSCEIINDNAQYLSKTIDTFANYIKEEKTFTKAVLQELLDVSLKILQGILEYNNIKLINKIRDIDDIELMIYKGELSQVIINIVNNAKDILNEKNIHDKQIKIEIKKDNEFCYINIEDNAGGVPIDIIDKVFDPYFTTKHQSKGTGLGLYMSREIVQKSLHGELTVKNSKDGAIFTIKLPL